MRSLKMVLAIVAVLALTGTTFAAFEYSVERTAGFDSTTLDSYTVRMGGVKTFTNINIWANIDPYTPNVGVKGAVHQVNEFGGFPSKAVKTLWLGLMAPESEPFDTHFLFAYDAQRLEIGAVAAETSVKNTSPTGISTDAYGFFYGVGTFSAASTDGFTLPSELAAGTPFMQIVVPKMGEVWLAGTTVVDGQDRAFQIFVPEPGTIALLIGGALCLVAVRFRKK